MTEIEIIAQGAAAWARTAGVVTAGAVGIPVTLRCSRDWDGLRVIVKIRCGEVLRQIEPVGAVPVTVPWDCLTAGRRLEIALDGWDSAGTLRIPTNWVSCALVQPSGAEGGGTPEPPELLTQKLLQWVDGAEGKLEALDSAVDICRAASEAVQQNEKTIRQLTENDAAQAQALSRMQRAIRFQAELARGQVWDFEEEHQEAYVRSVPTGAHAAAVMEIGGKTVAQDGALVSGAVSSVLAEGPGQEPVSCPIPAAVQALPGYGWGSGGACNSIQRRGDKWVYVQRTAKFVYDGNTPKLGADSNYQQATQKFNYIYSLDIHDLAPNSRCISTIGEPVGLATGFNTGGAYCTTTISVFIPNQATGGTRDEYIAACRSYLRDHPVTVHYELATPIETDITDLMGDALSPIAVEPGGSLTMKNAGELAVPATVKYITKLSEVSANG